VPNLDRLLTSKTRIKVFLKIMVAGPISTTDLAKALNLPAANVSYHLKRLEAEGFVEVAGGEKGPFKKKLYSVSKPFYESLRPENLNNWLLEGEAPRIKNFIIGLLLVAGESLKAIGEAYAKEEPLSFVEKFLFEKEGLIGMVPISLFEKKEFIRELKELVVRHLSHDPPKMRKEQDALAVIGVLPLGDLTAEEV